MHLVKTVAEFPTCSETVAMERLSVVWWAAYAKLPESQTRYTESKNSPTRRVFDSERAKTCRVTPY